MRITHVSGRSKCFISPHPRKSLWHALHETRRHENTHHIITFSWCILLGRSLSEGPDLLPKWVGGLTYPLGFPESLWMITFNLNEFCNSNYWKVKWMPLALAGLELLDHPIPQNKNPGMKYAKIEFDIAVDNCPKRTLVFHPSFFKSYCWWWWFQKSG